MGILDDAAQSPTCGTCHWWRVTTDASYGNCVRHSPTRLSETIGNAWPITHKVDWCGDFDTAAK